MREIEINGQKFDVLQAEENPVLVSALINECEKRNEQNPDLIRLNKNTWIKKISGNNAGE